MTALVPILIALVGALVYALSSNGKLVELGRIAFFVGLFWTVYSFAGAVVSVLR